VLHYIYILFGINQWRPFRIFPCWAGFAFDEGLKYQGFNLKPNDYRKVEWMWLIARIEKRLTSWSHRWLSRVGQLVLIKSFLEAIYLFWMSVARIPKGISNKIQKCCCGFLWRGTKYDRTFAWVIWDRISLPKKWGGWGIKNIFCFFQALTIKSGWRLFSTNNLWMQVFNKKYIHLLSLT